MKKIILSVFVAIIVIVFFVHNSTRNSVSENLVEKIFLIDSGDDVITIGANLEDQNFISSRAYFYYYVWKNKLRGQISAGDYIIGPKSGIEEIVHKITSGEAVLEKKEDVKITFPEGWTIKKMADRLNENELPGAEFLKMANTPSDDIYGEYTFLSEGESLEGYLYPDTYFLMKNTDAETIIYKMLDNFENRVDEDRMEKISQSKQRLHDILVFASIVEGEVPVGGDRHIVAGIFKNRLDINMALQSDATIDYIKGIPEMKHTQADIEIDSPYNTYKYPGLPPGPINNPSIESIDAVLMPTETDYMYFLNNVETGETVFSKTFAEHIRNKGLNGL